jgi:hypothetical protein
VRHFTVLCGSLIRKQNRCPPSEKQWIKWGSIGAINPAQKAEPYNYLRLLMRTYVGLRSPFLRDITHLIMPNRPRHADAEPPGRHPSTSIVFHYLRDSHRSHNDAIASRATHCTFDLAVASPARVDSHVAPGTVMIRPAARAHETGLTENTRVPWPARLPEKR